MTDQLVLYTNPMSRGRIARWMLEEVGQPYRTELLDYGTTMKAPEYLALNPMGKVPALRHGDTVVTETAAICAYLADAFPQAGLAPPPASRLRGPYYRWLFFAAGPLEAAVTAKALRFEVPPGPPGHGGLRIARRRAGRARSGQLAGWTYLVGDRFTAADLYVASHFAFGMMFGSIRSVRRSSVTTPGARTAPRSGAPARSTARSRRRSLPGRNLPPRQCLPGRRIPAEPPENSFWPSNFKIGYLTLEVSDAQDRGSDA